MLERSETSEQGPRGLGKGWDGEQRARVEAVTAQTRWVDYR